MIIKTVPKPSTVVFSKKVKGEKRLEVIDWCEEFGLDWVRLK